MWSYLKYAVKCFEYFPRKCKILYFQNNNFKCHLDIKICLLSPKSDKQNRIIFKTNLRFYINILIKLNV